MNINPSGNVIVSGSLGVNNQQNLYFPESSTTSYANIFRQSSTAATVVANGYKYSPTAGGFASSFTTTARTAIQVGGGNISFFTDPSSTVAVGTDITPSERLSILNSGNIGVGYTSPAAKLAVNGTTLINTNTDNGVDKLQVSGSMNVSAGAKAQSLSVTNNIDQGSGSADAFYTILANSTSSGWAGRFGSKFSTGAFEFQHRNNSPTFVTLATFDSPGGDGLFSVFDQLRVVDRVPSSGKGKVLINSSTDNGVDKLQVEGSISGIGMKQAYVTKTGAYTATNADYVIDCTSGTFTVTLPASSGRTGRILIIKNSGAGTITVDGNGAETIDGAATYSLAVQYATVQIMSDGTNWKIIAKF
jgi:hypothetical protein